MSLEILPNELLRLVAGYLGAKDLNALLRTNKFFVQLLTAQLHSFAAQNVGGWSALSWAASKGHESLVRLLLSQEPRVDVNFHDIGFEGETTALHQTAVHGYARITKLLLENGADVESQVFMGSTALHLGVRYGHEPVVRVLLENGANPNAVGGYQRTPLQMAMVSRSTLESRYSRSEIIEVKDESRARKIRQKVEQATLAIVRTLLEYGADIRTRDVGGRTILHLAVSYAREWGEFDTVPRLLLDSGAEVGVVDDYGWSELQTAIYHGHTTLVNLLLEGNIDLESPAERKPLHLAVRLGKLEIVKSLLEKGANARARDQDGKTILHRAALCGCSSPDEYQPKIEQEVKLELVSLFLHKEVDINAQDADGCTALHYAISAKDPATVSLLLGHRAGANFEIQDHKGRRPLHYAARVGCVLAVKALLGKSAQVDVRDVEGHTPLDLTYRSDGVNMVATRKLLRNR